MGSLRQALRASGIHVAGQHIFINFDDAYGADHLTRVGTLTVVVSQISSGEVKVRYDLNQTDHASPSSAGTGAGLAPEKCSLVDVGVYSFFKICLKCLWPGEEPGPAV